MDKGEKVTRRTIVLSGVNLIDGGALSVFKDALYDLSRSKYLHEYEIIVAVNNRKLFSEFESIFVFKEYPNSKKSWLNRLWTEYYKFDHDFRGKDIYWWISMHDITPCVRTQNQAVYCHNAAPFYRASLQDAKYGPKEYLFSKLYKYLYRIRIKKNKFVIVQQEWIKDEFKELFDIDNILVAKPSSKQGMLSCGQDNRGAKSPIRFIYPAFPRVFKNFEVICEACEILNSDDEVKDYEVMLTINGSENRYARNIVKRYKHVRNINFCGTLSREEVYRKYSESDAIIFSSKLETWGMPILEFQETKRPLLLADLPYARETSRGYENKVFFNPSNPYELAASMKDIILGHKSFCFREDCDVRYEGVIDGWSELFNHLFSDGTIKGS